MPSNDIPAEYCARMQVIVDRTGPAIHRTLSELDPENCVEFEREFHQAMAESDDDFDLDRVQKVINRYWAVACAAANPAPYVNEVLERIKNGDESVFGEEWRPQADGTNHVYRRNAEGNWAFSHVLRPGDQ
ncbi:DUF6247 family protein [Saccharopolyspora sp. K220]|uniref:DUF6247 family protein n=1 Tax=Saccharopolyspora soli TaxID=2926618 RepID=UPI001F59B015|nr:DUF6247 family protein [Saccharopolyspora soli]MCI2417104.1 DUF6247 family protein [Saccharopolyspora soli]